MGSSSEKVPGEALTKPLFSLIALFLERATLTALCGNSSICGSIKPSVPCEVYSLAIGDERESKKRIICAEAAVCSFNAIETSRKSCNSSLPPLR